MSSMTFERASALVQVLRERSLRISFAESLTGGMISSSVVDISGASDVFDGAVVSYTDEVKINVLKVPSEVIREHTAVSHECAEYMAAGVRSLLGSNISVSATGYADGPMGGTVYLGISSDSGTSSVLFNATGDRNEVREQVVIRALEMIDDAVRA